MSCLLVMSSAVHSRTAVLLSAYIRQQNLICLEGVHNKACEFTDCHRVVPQICVGAYKVAPSVVVCDAVLTRCQDTAAANSVPETVSVEQSNTGSLFMSFSDI